MNEDEYTCPNCSTLARRVEEMENELEGTRGDRDIAREDRDALLALGRAVEGLSRKLKEIEDDPSYKSIWVLAHAHGAAYRGPNYAQELEKVDHFVDALPARLRERLEGE